MTLAEMAIFLLLLSSSYSGASAKSPDSVVHALYGLVVVRHPLGIPKGADKEAIWPLLSKKLRGKLETVQACESDYFHQHGRDTSKPEFGWLESGIFSGANERGLPAKAVVEQTERQQDGSTWVYVRLAYNNPQSSDSVSIYQWMVAAKVVSERGQFVVDDVLIFQDDSDEIQSRLSDSFVGCDGPRWRGVAK